MQPETMPCPDCGGSGCHWCFWEGHVDVSDSELDDITSPFYEEE